MNKGLSLLERQIRSIGRRLLGESLLRGVAVVVGVLFLAALASTWWLSHANFSDSALLWTRVIVGGLGLAILLKFLILPLFRPPRPRRVARFLEERYPELEDRLSTAVELRESPGRVHPEIRRLIADDAARKLRALDLPPLFHRQRSLFSVLATIAFLAVFLSIFWMGPPVFRYSLDRLALAWSDDSAPPLYSIEVTPGNARVVRHADIEIRARLVGFDSAEVRMIAKSENRPDWDEAEMRPDPDGSEFIFRIFDTRDRLEYFVEADGIRSDRYVIEVSDAPTVKSFKITLNFPRHTGLPPQVLENEGDLRVLEGTEASFSILTDQPVQAGMLKLEDLGEVALELVSPLELKGTLTVRADDYYRIHLQNSEGVWSPGSDEYVIEALIDQPPLVSFSRPGRDQKVTNLEEVFTEIKASDDFGVRSLRLHYTVNGEERPPVTLDIPRNAKSVTTSQTFYLEEYDLLPGDFVSYYAEAADAVSSAQTDIFFLEVQPYDRQYSQSQQAAGGGGGGAGEDLFLSKLQKEIVAATFNALREQKTLDTEKFEENVQTIALMQQQVRQQAEAIVDRIERRGAATEGEMFQQMSGHLKQAMVHMTEAHAELSQNLPEPALPPEQKALQQLLRAEALFKDIQLAMASSAAGGGGGASAEELADLVDLELDQKKNQYETLQQNRQQGQDEALDEAARKLKELAERQQQEMERRRRQMTQQSSGGGGSASQQELLEEIEELARQLERLSREKRDQQLNEVSRQLRQAARDLRQSQSQGSQEESQMRAQQALERLKQARNTLNRQQQNELSQSLEQLAQESRRIQEEQQEIIDRIGELEEKRQRNQVDSEFVKQLRGLINDKGELQDEVQRLESDLHQTARRLESQEPEASRKLKEAGLSVRDQRIPEKMQEGSELLARAWTEMARQREESVARDLEQLAENVERARESVGKGESGDNSAQSEAALERLGNLVEDLESLRERAERAQGGDQGSEQREQDGQAGNPQQAQGRENQQRESGQAGEAGEQQGRQPGERQGRQGQTGQQGQEPGEQEGSQGQPGEEQQGEPTEAPGQSGGVPTQSQGRQRSERASSMANSTGINPQGVRREWQERIEDAERLRDMMRQGDAPTAREIAELARKMRQLDAERIFDDPDEITRLKEQIIEGFRELELKVYRSLQKDERLQQAWEEEVPREYRNRVDEYYKALATGRRPPQ